MKRRDVTEKERRGRGKEEEKGEEENVEGDVEGDDDEVTRRGI